MSPQKFMHAIFILLLSSALGACTKSGPQPAANLETPSTPTDPKNAPLPAPPEALPEIKIPLEEVASDGCLRLDKLQARLLALNLPTGIMTTDHRAKSEVSEAMKKYFAFSSFEYRTAPTGTLLPLGEFTQDGCKEITSKTTSGEPLKFNIVKRSMDSLTLELSKNFAKETLPHVAKAFAKRLHPVSYVITYDPETFALEIISDYKTFDPLCSNEKMYELITTKKMVWAHRADLLPATYKPDASYAARVKEAAVDGNVPGLSDGTVTVAALAPAQLQPDLLKCR